MLGSNQFGQLGCDTDPLVTRIPCNPEFQDGVRVTDVACGDMFTVALSSGKMACKNLEFCL